jgi:hypothetical protein
MKLCRLCSKPLPPDRMNCTMLGEQSPEYYYVHSTCHVSHLLTVPITHLPVHEIKQAQILESAAPAFIATTTVEEPLAKGAPSKKVPKP